MPGADINTLAGAPVRTLSYRFYTISLLRAVRTAAPGKSERRIDVGPYKHEHDGENGEDREVSPSWGQRRYVCGEPGGRDRPGAGQAPARTCCDRSAIVWRSQLTGRLFGGLYVRTYSADRCYKRRRPGRDRRDDRQGLLRGASRVRRIQHSDGGNVAAVDRRAESGQR